MERTATVMRASVESGLVDQAVVVDGGSTDATMDIAREVGTGVLRACDMLPHLGPVLGKGDSLYRAVHATEADAFVFLDADIGNVHVGHVEALVEAIRSPGVSFVKGGFVRIDENGVPRKVPGGRVTEEVGRPLLRMVDPFLGSLSQPLSGQVAIVSDLALSIPFATGYGVEIAMLIDVWQTTGETAIVEADMGTLHNRWKSDASLDEVRRQVIAGHALRMQIPSGISHNSHPMVVLRSPRTR